MTTATIPDLKGFETHYGMRVSDIGEDGNVVILGHHDKRRALAALNRHARTFWGLPDLYDGRLPMFRESPAVDHLRDCWATLVKNCGDPGHAADCFRCRELAEADWWIDYSANETDPDAFPVMVWGS